MIFLLLLAIQGHLTSTEPSIDRAYTDRDSVCVDVGRPLVDWNAVARRQFGAKGLKDPAKDLLRKHVSEGGGDSILPFTEPVAAGLARNWFILHEKGADAFKPATLKGGAMYRVTDDFRVVGAPQLSGQVCGSAGAAPVHAAFVLRGRSATVAGKPRVIDATPGWITIRWKGTDHGLEIADVGSSAQVSSLQVFRTDDAAHYVLITWKNGDCESVFSLYKLGSAGAAKHIQSNLYACDV